MALRPLHRPANDPPCSCGAPFSALRLALIAAIIVFVALLMAAVRTAGAASTAPPAGGKRLGPACAPLPVVTQHRYRMAAKIRPLLFWIGRDNIGEAHITWRGDGDARGFELLIGSDPDRAPRRINRWGYIAEAVQGSGACIVGVMKQSDENSIQEAESRLATEGRDGRHVFKAIREVANRDEIRAGVTTVRVNRDLTYRDLDEVLGAMSTGSQTSDPHAVRLAPGTRPGFLTALAELIHASADAYRHDAGAAGRRTHGPIEYVYNNAFLDVKLKRSDIVRSWRIGTRSVGDVVRAEFEWRNRQSGERSEFEVTYGIDGPFAEIPVAASYQPRWWFQVDLTLDDAGSF
jgi:hypothetical protein